MSFPRGAAGSCEPHDVIDWNCRCSSRQKSNTYQHSHFKSKQTRLMFMQAPFILTTKLSIMSSIASLLFDLNLSLKHNFTTISRLAVFESKRVVLRMHWLLIKTGLLVNFPAVQMENSCNRTESRWAVNQMRILLTGCLMKSQFVVSACAVRLS